MCTDICHQLKLIQEELKKHSIYITDDDSDYKTADANERGFDFFVFVDPWNQGQRGKFLRELHHIINEGDPPAFIVESHKKQMKNWVKISGDNIDDEAVRPLNWLKIAIERYPYRLFVAIDKNGSNSWNKLKFAPIFVKKRICFINKCDIDTMIMRMRYKRSLSWDELRLFLLSHWVYHLICNTSKRIVFDPYPIICLSIRRIGYVSRDKSAIHIPESIPEALYGVAKGGKKEENRPTDILIFFDYLISKDIRQLIKYTNPIATHDIILKHLECCKGTYCPAFLYFELNRHRSPIRIKKSSRDDIDSPAPFSHPGDGTFCQFEFIYGEELSGSLSYFLEIQDALNDSIISRYKLMQIIEMGLLRVAIIDERIQEWFNKQDAHNILKIIQQKVLVSFWEKDGLYGQSINRKDGFVGKIGPQCNEEQECQISIAPLELFENSKLNGDPWPELKSEKPIIDILILHQGIIDKWASSKPILSDILKWKDNIPFLIFTSGRGRPHNLTLGVKFLPFSSLEHCTNGNRFEKITLVQELMALIEEKN